MGLFEFFDVGPAELSAFSDNLGGSINDKLSDSNVQKVPFSSWAEVVDPLRARWGFRLRKAVVTRHRSRRSIDKFPWKITAHAPLQWTHLDGEFSGFDPGCFSILFHLIFSFRTSPSPLPQLTWGRGLCFLKAKLLRAFCEI